MVKLIFVLMLIYNNALPSTNGLTFTFDDGPTRHTVKILNILKKHKIKAVFCIPAKNLYNKKALAIAKRAVREGHIICNHSWNHPRFDRLTKKQQKWQIVRAQQMFKQKLGIKPRYLRPPFGIITKHMRYYAAYYGMEILYWSIDSRDWSPKISKYRIYHRVINKWRRRTLKGKDSIVIFHDTNARTEGIIEKIILRVKKGYKIKK